MKLTFGITAALFVCTELWAQPRIEIERVGTGAQLTWTGGVLQSASLADGPWFNVSAAASPYKVAAGQPMTFFRVQQTFIVTVGKSGAGSGTVRWAAGGIVCGTNCVAEVLSGRNITIEATPDQGSTFVGWTGDCTGSGDCQLSINGPRAVTATFAQAVTKPAVTNGDFEGGRAIGWQQFPGPLVFSATELGVPAHSGQYMARLGYDQDNRRLAQIGQQITLPNSTPLFLNFALWLYSEELCDVPYYDGIALYIAGQTVVKDDRVCRGSDTGGWRQFSVDVSALAGQTVGIVFEISSADVLTSVMLLDDVAISGTAWQ